MDVGTEMEEMKNNRFENKDSQEFSTEHQTVVITIRPLSGDSIQTSEGIDSWLKGGFRAGGLNKGDTHLKWYLMLQD